MNSRREIKVPDIGDFEKVPVIEVLVAEGDEVEAEQSLLTLESDKATMEVPSPESGRLVELKIAEGDELSEGDVIGTVEVADEEAEAPETEAGGRDDSAAEGEPAENGKRKTESVSAESGDFDFDLVVLGSGPGGYTAAFRAADLGLKVALIERYESLGGVCLNVGCIPSKALLHVGQVIDSAAQMAEHGVKFGTPAIDPDALRDFKNGAVGKLTGGLAGMAKKRGVEVVTGTGAFRSPHEVSVERDGETRALTFSKCIVAAGSRVIRIPGVPWDDERVMDSTAALELAEIPDRLLVVGGGIIGLEMACVYRALGSKVTVVEMLDRLMAGADADLVKPLRKHMEAQGVTFHLQTKVAEVKARDEALKATFEGDGAPDPAEYDRVLVCVGRRPNGDVIDADKAGIDVDRKSTRLNSSHYS